MSDNPENAATVDSLTDPETLRDRDGVRFETDERTVGESEFPAREAWDGMAVVGVTDDDGAVLLVYLDGHGWVLPHGPVEPGEDYVAAGSRWVERLTGVVVDVTGVERVSHNRYVDGDRETTGYDVVLRASPVAADPVPVASAAPDDVTEVGWFTEEPADADWDHDDFGADVRRLLD